MPCSRHHKPCVCKKWRKTRQSPTRYFPPHSKKISILQPPPQAEPKPRLRKKKTPKGGAGVASEANKENSSGANISRNVTPPPIGGLLAANFSLRAAPKK